MKEVMKNGTVDFILGNVTGVATDRTIMENYRILTYLEGDYAWIRSYHIALSSYVLYQLTHSGFLNGLTTSFLIMESIGPNPFGLGLPGYDAAMSWTLGVGLLGMLGVVVATK